MAKLRLVVTHTPKDSNHVLNAVEYLSTVTSLPAPHDYTTVKSQDGTYRDSSPFRKINQEYDENTHIKQVTFLVDDMSTVPDLTVENAYDVSSAIHLGLANAHGSAEYRAWIKDYQAEHFSTSWTATIEP
jgi:hypothetical protein